MHIYQKTHAVLKRAAYEVEASLAWLGAAGTPRSRMIGSAATVLVMHALVLWLLVIANPKALPYRELDTEPAIDTELYEFVPPEEQVEPVPTFRPREVVERPVERQVEPEPQPQSKPEPVPVPQPAPQMAQETYRALPQAVTQSREDLDPVRKVDTRRLNDQALRTETDAPSVVAERDAAEQAKLNAKKKEDEGRIEAQRREALASPGASDLNLHETPMPSIPNIAPSGLAADTPGRSSGGGAPPAGGAATGGGLKGGRSGVSQALMNHESCVALQQAGKPIPAGCNMKQLVQMQGLGTGDPAGRAHYGPIVAKKEAYDDYKRSGGNADYWKRVNTVGKDKFDRNPPSKGAYSNPKDARVKGQ
ncbi:MULTISPECIES: hypothetical protein [Asticcacaulis]|uniref:hypothetical protein n=1 Tax=Asticcacaulis TaxID=76890 RepID=UPI001AE79591|nr:MULTISPECIES: hypothetical protein [Asticcacaulis]MBP2158522.1 hypothetical protein [Asticcacaulis solisilvae]MDR6799568.1 hypothetical protein [Asticcacaulis sp. BE141]